MKIETKYFGTLNNEFSGVDLGDRRLTNRLVEFALSAVERPTESIPKMFKTSAEVEGAYRFLRNEKVSFDKVLGPHTERTSARVALEQESLIIHDWSEFGFNTKRDGLGFLTGSKSAGDGFYCHLSLAASFPLVRPLGVIATEIIIKDKIKGYLSPAKRRKDETRKSLWWERGIEASRQALSNPDKVIHVADREGDIYELLNKLSGNSEGARRTRFVIRANHNRKVVREEKAEFLSEVLETSRKEVKFKREVNLSARANNVLPRDKKRHPARTKRIAHLEVTSTSVELVRGHHHGARFKERLAINVVHVFEPNPPLNEEAIEWKLYTNEPIETIEQVEKVIDIYRARWLIEEYFKALKTGCAFESRQLESKQTILNALAIFIPVAWQLLLLRSEANNRPDSPATIALNPTQILVLRAVCKNKLPELPTVSEALLAVARLGGHLKQNGPPGWQTLSKGFSHLLTMEMGWLAAQRYDQS